MQHLTQKQFEDYSKSQLNAAELLSIGDHLTECESCQRHLQRVRGNDDALLALYSEVFDSTSTVSSHLSLDQAANYVDKTLPAEELQIAKDHLLTCERCNLAINDLQIFRNEIAPSLDHEYKPRLTTKRRPAWWQLTFKSSPSWFYSPIPALSAALALLVFAGIGWMIWRSRSDNIPKQEIAAVPSPSPMLPAQPSPSQEPPQQLTARLQLNDNGRQLILDQSGSLTGAEDLSAPYQALIKRTLTAGRIERSSQLSGLTRAGSSLMSSDKSGAVFSIKDPVGSVLLTDRPTFRWTRLEGAGSYVVEIYDTKFQPVLLSPAISSESWTATMSLPRGAIYNWQVKATKNGEEVTSPRPPAAQAKFRILDQIRANQIARARQASPPSHLTLALLYADAGLFGESAEQLRQLQKENPKSGIVSNLLRQVQAMKRRH